MSIEVTRFKFTITGITALLLHADLVEEADALKTWQGEHKSLSVPGDDRSPPWTWQTYLNSDDEFVVFPSDNIMSALRKAGAMVILKGQTTFKSATQSGLLIEEEHCPVIGPKGQVKIADLKKFESEPFAVHAENVKALGFRLFVKRAKVGQNKHVRVRARFDAWNLTGIIQVSDPAITLAKLTEIFNHCGTSVGLGDWRPSAPKSPGPYGRFSVKLVKQ